MESYIEVNLANIVENYKKIRNYTKKNIIAVIKDNAYGHSLIHVGKALNNINAFMLAVSQFNEAITLRKNMIFSPILLLGRCDDAKTLYALKITQSVSSLDHLKILANSKVPLSIHLKIDSGMHRLGLLPEEIEEALSIIKNSSLRLKGVYTHFCVKENSMQKKIFKEIVEKYFTNTKLIIHSQASSYIEENLSYCNAIRIGLALYGYHQSLNLTPCLKLLCPIIRCQKIENNVPIGYDFTEKTEEKGYILTIPFGYSSGLSRLKKLCFSFKNKIIYQIGKSCMDLTMFFSEDEISSGTEIELLSESNLSNLLTLNDESIYYLLSSLSPSIKRVFK